MSEDVAQTNLELYQQVQRAGYDHEALDLIRRTYDVAIGLFGTRLQSSGRPFVCHLVGTASILASLERKPPLVAAGLLHSAFRPGASAQQSASVTAPALAERRAIIETLGSGVADYVARFEATERSYRELRAALPDLGPTERDVVVMLLADELEKLSSHNVLYGSRVAERLQRSRAKGEDMVALARDLAEPRLAAEIARALESVLTARIPAALTSNGETVDDDG